MKMSICVFAAKLLAVAVISLAMTSPMCAQDSAADTILIHARVYTVNQKQPWAEAVAIRDGKFVAVGTETEVRKFSGARTQVIDAKGKLVLPGFTDCHVHFMDGSVSMGEINVEDVATVDELRRQLKAYAEAHAADPWVLGRGWKYPLFPPTGLPDKKLLDEIVPDRPAYLASYDGHTWWANSKALQAAHINKETADPPGGSFVRDPQTGEPTGAIKEDAADDIVRRAIPEPSREEKLKALRAGIKHASELGVTRVHVLGGVSAGQDDLQNVELFQELRKAGELSVRFYLAYRLDPPRVTEQQLKAIVEARDRYHDDWISGGSAKIFLDGVIETHTAAMLAPYSDNPAVSGQLLWEPGEYKRGVFELDKRNIQVFTHAIGDRAIRLALDAYGEAAKTNATKDARHRIEHIEDVSAEDIPRFGQLGVIASMQPLHAYPDDDLVNVWARNVGPERAKRGFAWHSIQSAGGVLAFGSDWPIVTLSPWPGLQNAVTRQTTEGEPKGGWMPSERVSLAEGIRGYTLDAAYAGHREKEEGSLEPGKLADLIIVSQDLFKIDTLEIGKTKVLLTMVGGRVVYKADGF